MGNTRIAHGTQNVPTADQLASFPPGASAADQLTKKSYVDLLVAGLLDLRGTYDAHLNAWPATGGSGTAGAVMKGDFWIISVGGTLGGKVMEVSDVIIAIIDTPGQTVGNWATLSLALGYVPVDTNDSRLLRIYADITAAKAATGVDGLVCYVKSIDNFYRGLAAGSAYTANDKEVLITGNGGNTRWIGQGPRYVADGRQTNVVIAAATGPLTAAQCSATVVTNAGQAAENTSGMPPAVAGLAFVQLAVTAGMGAWHMKPDSGENVILAGVVLAADHKVSLAVPAVGDSARFICVEDGTWMVDPANGTFIDGGE